MRLLASPDVLASASSKLCSELGHKQLRAKLCVKRLLRSLREVGCVLLNSEDHNLVNVCNVKSGVSS
jgi:hypothetical protein